MAEDKVLISESILTDIANAIRNVGGYNTTYLPSEMPEAIDSLSSVEEKQIREDAERRINEMLEKYNEMHDTVNALDERYDQLYERKENKTQYMSVESTDEQYPTAKAVYELLTSAIVDGDTLDY